VVQGYRSKGLCTSRLLKWADLPGSTFYYKHGQGKPGRKPSTHTFTLDGSCFDNQVVVGQIEQVLQQEFCCYGYHMMREELQENCWIINHKKVYRLMKENHLLCNHRIQVHGAPRPFVKFRKVMASRPLEYLCMDIKHVHLYAEGRNALLLTIMDIYSRKVLLHMLRYSIKKGDVLILLSLLLLEYRPVGMTLRSDNGSQFVAAVVRQYLKSKGVYQEFTHVATPEDNSYIEALHSNLQREVMNRFELETLADAQSTINRYYQWYNEKRRHWALKKGTPQQKWDLYFNPLPEKTKNLPYALQNENDLLNQKQKTLQEIGV
jgi:putative transposase